MYDDNKNIRIMNIECPIKNGVKGQWAKISKTLYSRRYNSVPTITEKWIVCLLCSMASMKSGH